jgi:RNA polymerase sigma factor (sigma-70 family)
LTDPISRGEKDQERCSMRQPGDTRSDAALVQAYLAGDRDALGALYDRFSPGLFDTARAMLRDSDAAGDVVQDVFCVAATRLAQLRDPDRVKPWLYAVARHEIYRRTKRRSREGSSLDAYVEARGDDPMASPDPFAEAAGVVSADLASFVRDAAAGLDESDQLLLELSARQGLVGADLAAAMGISAGQAHSMLFRMRERLERAVGAVVVARAGRRRCPELATVLTNWDGSFDVLWRKRIARHIDACDTCQETRKGAAVLSLAGAAPAFAAPLALRDRTLHAAEAAARAAGSGEGSGSGDGSDSGHGSGSGDGADGAGGGEAMAEGADEATARYRFDADGFPTGVVRQRSLVGPLMGSLTAVFVLALVMWMLPGRGVSGAVSDQLVLPPPTSTSTSTTSTSTTSTSTTSTSTSTTTSSTTTSTTTTSTTPSTTVAAAPPTPSPTSPPTPPPTPAPNDPPTGQVAPTTTRPPRDTAPPTAPPTVPTTTRPAVVGVVTTTTPPTTRPAGVAALTTTTIRIVVIAPVVPLRTTTTVEPPR